MKARNSLCVALAALAMGANCRNVDLPEEVRFVSSAEASGAGIHVNPASGLTTTEAGGTATFAVSLVTKPTANVTVTLTSNNTGEGQIKQTAGACATGGTAGTGSCTLTFTDTTWLNPQNVTVVGQNDDYVDGNIAYKINLTATSADSDYNGQTATANLTNNDNDTAGFTATPSSGLVTKTDGSTATYQLKLSSQPTANVAFTVVSNDTSEGQVTTPVGGSFTFTNGNWNINQNLVVTGQAADGDEPKAYKIILSGSVSSGDANYNAITGTLLHTGISLTNISSTNKRIFKVSSGFSGNFGGIAGGDNKCNTDGSKPPGTYKAIITGTTRRACTTANCTNAGENLDWALYPNTAYVRPDGTAIATTNSAGIFIFPLTNAIDPAGFSPRTGLYLDWTSWSNCSNWTSTAGTGVIGSSSQTSNLAIYQNDVSCSNLYVLYCAEQ